MEVFVLGGLASVGLLGCVLSMLATNPAAAGRERGRKVSRFAPSA